MVLEVLQGESLCEPQSQVLSLPQKGIEVTISVPRGEEMAKKTLNERLGLLGGISILGTTGIVKPYSTAAYRASVVQAIHLAKTHGLDTVVLTTGGKSEKYAMDLHPSFPQMSFIQVGDFIGAGIKACVRTGLKRAMIVGMMGKLSKMADGRMMTHAAGSDVNFQMLSQIAASMGAGSSVCVEIEKAITARGVLEICQKAGFPPNYGSDL
jgi:cobalt-precorrin-5B (C1)-methyltransferase